MFNKKQTAFVEHIAALTKEIKELTEEIIRLTAEILRLTNLIKVANENIASFRERIENLNNLLSDMAAANKADNEYYNQKIADLGRLYNAFTQIIARLNELKGSSSGKGIYSHIAQTESEKRDIEYRKTHPNAFVEKKEDKKFLSFLQVAEKAGSTKEIVQLAKKATKFIQTGVMLEADQAALAKLVGILAGIQDETLVKKANTVEHLNNINAKYAELKAQAEEEVKQNEASLKAQIANRDRYVEERQQAIEEKKAMNIKLLGELRETHANEKAARAEEAKVVDLLVGIVERRLLGK